ncbi:MAG: methyltransferase regulatory domain-containing protein [Planctomycetales bacterium]|nr:methyltransferase regulatory domain-containing protein [Planctomycetales bacterium]
MTKDTTTTSNDYDTVPYPGGAFPGTHPSHLAMVGRLCQVETPEPKNCRVLELGCAVGANIAPMAISLPDSEFVGIDLSAKQVEYGNQMIKDAGIKNVELKHLDITEVTPDLGKFDYIICHGVYSWVPANVQEAILKAGKELLTDKGIQYVSYNTLPGWNLRGVIRDMMRYHVQHLETPEEKIAQARGLLEFLSKSVKTGSEAYATLMKDEAELLRKRGDYYIYHEHLEAENEPLYFHQFVDRVDKAGLRYVADTAVSTMVAQMFDDDAAEILRDVPVLQREQYMDFLRARMFRCSLLAHQTVDVSYRMHPSVIEPLHVRLHQPAFIEQSNEDQSMTTWQYGGQKWTTAAPFTGVIEKLQRGFPGWASVKELTADIEDAELRQSVMESLLMSHMQGLVALSYSPVDFCTKVSDAPTCNEMARTQLKYGNKVTTLLHSDYFVAQPQQRLLLEHMDGTNSSEQLAKVLADAVNQGHLQVSDKDGKVENLDDDFYTSIVNRELERFVALAMLAG